MIEGRRCYDDIKKAYPGTHTIVLTKNKEREFSDAIRAESLEEGMRIANEIEGYPTIWIGGGQSIYEEALSMTDRLYLTLVHTEVEGDTFFPEWRDQFTKVISERRSSNGKYDYTFFVLERESPIISSNG